MLVLEFFDQELLEVQIEIFTTEGSITVGSFDLKDTT